MFETSKLADGMIWPYIFEKPSESANGKHEGIVT